MSKSNIFENDFLKLILNGTPIANLADNAAASPAANLYLSLHTADPGEAGDQTTSESAYAGYARVAVPRSAAGWTVTANVANLTSNRAFPNSTASGATITHFGIGTSAAGAGKLLYKGPLNNNIAIPNAGIGPILDTGTTISEE